jgi:cell division protein FtsW
VLPGSIPSAGTTYFSDPPPRLSVVLSASSIVSFAKTGSSFTIAARQMTWLGLGLVAMIGGAVLPIRWLRRLGVAALVLSTVGLLAVLVPGIGSVQYGARRWIAVPGGQFQPSELAKLAFVLWGADLLVRKRRFLGEPLHLLIPLLPVGLLLAGLILLEPDMGTMMVLTAALFTLLVTVGAPRRILLWLTAGGLVMIALLAVAAPYRLARLTSFVNPYADASGSGYQAVQGLIALRSGGIFGVGIGASKQKWGALPNAYTDYIYAILGEELGLFGTLTVLLLLALFGYAGIRIALRAGTQYDQLIAAGITMWMMAQAILNIGAVTSVLPITGIPLPLISYGGSSLAVTLFAIGILLGVARREPDVALALARSRDGRGWHGRMRASVRLQ